MERLDDERKEHTILIALAFDGEAMLLYYRSLWNYPFRGRGKAI